MLDNSLQLFNRNISSTPEKYRNIPERISGAANKYRIHAGIFGFVAIAAQVRGALPHAPLLAWQGCRKTCGQTLPAPLVLASVASGRVKAMPSGGLGTRLDPALKAKNSCSRKVSFTKRLLKPFGAFNRKRDRFPSA
jgi:hypothetical protein